MASSRIYFQNLLSQGVFSAFQVAGGAVSMAPATHTDPYDFSAGTAFVAGRLHPTTGYTDVFERDYVVEVHVCPDGSFPTSRWRWSDTGGSVWNAQNLTPVSGVWVPLSFGVEVQFTQSGIAPEFVLGDYWYARTLRPYGIVKALDGSRNSEYRSGTMPPSSTLRIGWDLGTAQTPGFVALDDHNLPSNATVTLFADAAAVFDATPGYTLVVPWQANRMAALVTSGAFRYWWLTIVMGATSVPYLRLSELFLGTGATLRKQPTAGTSDTLTLLGSVDVAQAARAPTPRIYAAHRPQFTWRRVKRTLADDGGKLDAAYAYAREHGSYTMPPLWFLLQDDNLATVERYAWAGDLGQTHVVADLFDYSPDWTQLIRTVAS